MLDGGWLFWCLKVNFSINSTFMTSVAYRCSLLLDTAFLDTFFRHQLNKLAINEKEWKHWSLWKSFFEALQKETNVKIPLKYLILRINYIYCHINFNLSTKSNLYVHLCMRVWVSLWVCLSVSLFVCACVCVCVITSTLPDWTSNINQYRFSEIASVEAVLYQSSGHVTFCTWRILKQVSSLAMSWFKSWAHFLVLLFFRFITKEKSRHL